MYLFDDEEKRKQLKEILDSWIGTPFRHRSGVKGLGVDCAHFIACVIEEMGILRWRKNLIPDYPHDWHLHNTRELFKESIEKELPVESISIDDVRDGDLVLLHYGKAASHGAIYFEGYLFQAMERVGVCRLWMKEKSLMKRIRYVYRIKA